jgi:hypothetical protein
MAYRHKKAVCSKTSKDILENIVKLREAEYGLIEAAQTVRAGNPIHQVLEGSSSSNGLHSEAEETVSSGEVDTECIQSHDHATDDFEDYRPQMEVKFDAQEPKVRFEKKGKHRNYAEFRFDYGKL